MAAAMMALPVTPASAGLTEFGIPSAQDVPVGIAGGSDGVWFSLQTPKIARISTDGRRNRRTAAGCPDWAA
ncbi:MAG: hypothetical protein ACYC91_03650 [Solirubrobacteraceae bacterium]